MSPVVDRIESWLLRMPYAPDARQSPDDAVEIVGVDVTTDSGLRGMGFSYSLCGGGAAIRSLLDEAVSPRALGRPIAERVSIADDVRWALRRLGPGIPALAGAPVDIALWDLAAKHVGLPLHRMLGATRDEVPLFASGRYSPACTIERLVANATDDASQGHRAIKLRVGGSTVENDLQRIQAVRDAVGPRVELLVDGAELFTVPEARWLGEHFRALDIRCFEEPLLSEDLAGYRALSQSLTCSVAVGEHFTAAHQFQNAIASGAVDVLNPDVCILGGISEFLRVEEIVAASGRQTAPHLVCDLHVALGAASRSLLHVEAFPFTESLWQDPIQIHGGRATVPNRPGHGLSLDPDTFGRMRVK